MDVRRGLFKQGWVLHISNPVSHNKMRTLNELIVWLNMLGKQILVRAPSKMMGS